MKYFISFFFLVFITTLNAQSVILFEQDSVSQINENVNLSNEFPVDLFYKNNTGDSIAVNWRREFGANCPLIWDVFSADNLLSYPPFINESQGPNLLSPTDSNFIVRQMFWPQSVPGCCDLKMIFSLEGTPNNPIDTGYYHIEINSDGCITTSVSNQEIETINIYPNPSSNVINIESNFIVESIELLDLIGKIHYRSTDSNSNQINISSLSAGIYICKIKRSSGKILMKKVIKQ